MIAGKMAAESFIISGQTTETPQPGKEPLDHPAAR
jgi:hypothetical protein